MTVRVNKPAFDIREKLTQLDSAQVPYDKMPGGSVIQVVNKRATSDQTVSVNSWTAINDMYATIYPKFVDSKIWIHVMSHYYVQSTSSAPAWTGANYRLHSNKDGVLIDDPDYGQAIYAPDTAFRYMGHRFFTYVDTPNTTKPITYTVYGKCHNSNAAIQFHRGDYGMQGLITLMEIRQ